MAGYAPVPIVERPARLEQSLPFGSSPQTALRLLRLGYVGKSGSWERARTYRRAGRRFARRDYDSARVQGPAELHTPAGRWWTSHRSQSRGPGVGLPSDRSDLSLPSQPDAGCRSNHQAQCLRPSPRVEMSWTPGIPMAYPVRPEGP